MDRNLPETPSCPICGSHDIALSPGYRDYISGPATKVFKDLSLLACKTCHFGFAFPFIERQSLAEYYKSQYRSAGTPHHRQFQDLTLYSKYGMRALAQIQLAKTFGLGSTRETLFLDVGSGPGAALVAAQRSIPGVRLFAIEPDAHSAAHLQRICEKVYQLPFDQVDGEKIGERFDIINLSHVLEHFNAEDLEGVVMKLRSLLKPAGLISIEVPFEGGEDVASGSNNLTPHLSFFTIDSLQALLSKHLDVKFIQYAGEKIPDQTRAAKAGASSAQSSLMTSIKGRMKTLPIVAEILAVRRKLRLPDPAQVLATEQYTYGPGRMVLRAIAQKSAPIL